MEEQTNIPPIDFYKYKSPVTNPSNAELQKIKKEEFLFKWGIRFVLVFGFFLCGGIAFILYFYNPMNIDGDDNNNQNTPIPTAIGEQVDAFTEIQYESKSKKILPQGVDDYRRPELDLMKLVLDKAIDTRWSGVVTDNITFGINDLNAAELNDILQAQQRLTTTNTIPTALQQYFTADGVNARAAEIKQARLTYIEFLKTYGVDERYINEFTDYVLPSIDGRLTYIGTNSSFVIPLSNSDYSRIQIGISNEDIYERYLDLKKTSFAGDMDDSDLISRATELVTYEKLGFGVMQAYINKHVTAEVRSQGESDMWLKADVNYMKYSEDYFWAWNFNNYIHNSRVSNGLAYLAFSKINNLTEFQQNDLYDFVWEKENENANRVNEIGILLHRQYDNLLHDGIDQMPKIMYSELFADLLNEQNDLQYKEMVSNLENLSLQIGKQNPAAEKDLVFLKK